MRKSGWDKRPRRAPSKCHPERPARAFGLCDSCYLKDYRQKNLEKLKAKGAEAHLLRKYGISATQRDAMTDAQGGVCAICLQPPASGKRLHVDHCHSSKIVRGMLCHLCNSHLGLVDRDPTVIDRLVAYKSAADALATAKAPTFQSTTTA